MAKRFCTCGRDRVSIYTQAIGWACAECAAEIDAAEQHAPVAVEPVHRHAGPFVVWSEEAYGRTVPLSFGIKCF